MKHGLRLRNEYMRFRVNQQKILVTHEARFRFEKEPIESQGKSTKKILVMHESIMCLQYNHMRFTVNQEKIILVTHETGFRFEKYPFEVKGKSGKNYRYA